MKHFNEFILSVLSYPKALKVISQYGLLKYVFILIILLFVFVAPIIFLGEAMSFVGSYMPFIDGEKYAKVGSSFLSSISGFFLLLVLIPIFTLISDQVNYHIRGVKNTFSLNQFTADILRGLKITLRNFIYQYVIIVILLIILKLFSSNVLFSWSSNIVIFIVTSYFYGFSLMDYAMENHQMNYNKSVSFMRKHLGLAIGLGMVYYAVVKINDIQVVQQLLGNMSVYWSSFAEAIVAFIGVIAANIVLNVVIKRTIVNNKN